MNQKRTLALLLVLAVLFGAVLACAGTTDSLRIGGLPQYTCPSATPRATNTPLPTSPPTYPNAFLANLNYGYVDVIRSYVNIQYLAQSVGAIQVSYSGVTLTGTYWPGSNGWVTIGYAPFGSPGSSGSYPISIPSDVISTTITVLGGSSYSFTVPRYYSPFYTSPNPYPCCLPGAIYPTPVPTYTPYPTPTPYVRMNDYFVGDPIYAVTGTLRIRFKVTEITAQNTSAGTVQVWRLEVKNIGSVEYNLYPAAQMYVSEIVTPGGNSLVGVWGANLAAAEAAGITPTYDPVSLQPGQTQLFTLAAFTPDGTAYRVSYALDLTARGGGPTQVPGQNIVSWLNAVNTVCSGEITEP
jgi:hypothetical protein